MTIRYELDQKYIFQFKKEFELNTATIISPKIKIRFEDLDFKHLKFKNIHTFRILLLSKTNDIIHFSNLTEDWSFDFIVTENIKIQIDIEYSWKRHATKLHIMDWEEWIIENQVPQ
jgi:hypothetical protein